MAAAAQVSWVAGLSAPIDAEAVETPALPEGAAAALEEPCTPDASCPTLGVAFPALVSFSDAEAPLGDTWLTLLA